MTNKYELIYVSSKTTQLVTISKTYTINNCISSSHRPNLGEQKRTKTKRTLTGQQLSLYTSTKAAKYNKFTSSKSPVKITEISAHLILKLFLLCANYSECSKNPILAETYL